MSSQERYPEELRERSVRLLFESGRPVAQVAKDLGSARSRCARGYARPRPTPVTAPSSGGRTIGG